LPGLRATDHQRLTLDRSDMSPIQKLTEIRQSWHSTRRDRLAQYRATMIQVEALRVEVSTLEAEIRRTEQSDLAPAYKDARIRGLASRAAESYGRMLSLLRLASETYPAILNEPLDIPHSFTQEERQRLIYLPERPPALGRREVGMFLITGAGFLLGAILLTKLYSTVVVFLAFR
jgi:hypothetical protein